MTDIIIRVISLLFTSSLRRLSCFESARMRARLRPSLKRAHAASSSSMVRGRNLSRATTVVSMVLVMIVVTCQGRTAGIYSVELVLSSIHDILTKR